jgi:hypothetical protein
MPRGGFRLPAVDSNFTDPQRPAGLARWPAIDGVAMDMHAKEWKGSLDRLWSAPHLDFAQAARLVADIARSDEPALQRAAAQALPSLRGACLKGADRGAREVARRRLSAIRDVLHALGAPRFGKRGNAALNRTAH